MVVEIAIVEAKPGEEDAMCEGLKRARLVIERSPGYRGSIFQQGIENPARFVLYITWDSLADHLEGFRKGTLFSEWRSHWAHHLTGTPDVQHYEVIAGTP